MVRRVPWKGSRSLVSGPCDHLDLTQLRPLLLVCPVSGLFLCFIRLDGVIPNLPSSSSLPPVSGKPRPPQTSDTSFLSPGPPGLWGSYSGSGPSSLYGNFLVPCDSSLKTPLTPGGPRPYTTTPPWSTHHPLSLVTFEPTSLVSTPTNVLVPHVRGSFSSSLFSPRVLSRNPS